MTVNLTINNPVGRPAGKDVMGRMQLLANLGVIPSFQETATL